MSKRKSKDDDTAQTGPYGWQILIGLNRANSNIYAGTASPQKVARNRAANKRARVARRAGRR